MKSKLQLAQSQIQFARDYTLSLLADLEDDLWYRRPDGAPSHVAWQVGHLAMAQYGLCLFRQRGRQDIDRELMPSSFRKQFSRGSAPADRSAASPPPEQIRAVLDRVHQQAMTELSRLEVDQLSETVEPPYAVYPTKLGALLFCSHHEMIHAGQIGLLRRMLGKSPIR